ncbi:hypothetical protein NDU88_003448 [Pleurodeles waltl]|uniref:Uncharacterized protein n=1 Tax=Pleurodeles waltl TaxID=8319 RepID=A0AAV7VG52_PLEWA|nr:hypothetical protein NDU88_003448 [Pleurodeles waltl]
MMTQRRFCKLVARPPQAMPDEGGEGKENVSTRAQDCQMRALKVTHLPGGCSSQAISLAGNMPVHFRDAAAEGRDHGKKGH